MESIFSTRPRSSFQLPLVPAIVVGTALSIVLYGLTIYGPLDNSTLQRYGSHRAALVAMWLFLVAVSGLTLKLRNAFAQRVITSSVGSILEKFVIEGDEVARSQRCLWLEAHWLSLAPAQRNSWIGLRVAEIIDRQIKRGKHSQLESDVRELARTDAHAQRDSHALIRLVLCALPLLGLLGAVIGLSHSLGQINPEQLAGEPVQAIQQATTGALGALDTTAIALALAMTTVFIQFTVSRIEVDLLRSIDDVVSDSLVGFLGSDARPAEPDLLSPVRQMADDLVSAVHQLVEQQSMLWSRSIGEAQKQWTTWSTVSSDQLRQALCESLSQSLTQHAQEIERIQQEAGRQVDSRWQQWQITLSDQARVMHGQQKELVRQTEAIERLVSSTVNLQKLEEVVGENLGNVEMIEQLNGACTGVSEAVGLLTAGLERAGIIRGAPVKPRVIRKFPSEQADSQPDNHLDSQPDGQRKAA